MGERTGHAHQAANDPGGRLQDRRRSARGCGEAQPRGDHRRRRQWWPLLYLERPDRQSPNSVEIATLKARTAAYRERPSSALQERVKERPGWLMFPNSLPIAGGVPLFYGDECVGGVGVSGIADDDEVVAQAGAEALQA
jgi:hypothetical protein